MKVTLDIDAAGHEHFIDTDPSKYPMVYHPGGRGLTTVDQMLIHHDGHPDDREAGGWHEFTQLPGDIEPITKWDRLVMACNHQDADQQAKDLMLGSREPNNLHLVK